MAKKPKIEPAYTSPTLVTAGDISWARELLEFDVDAFLRSRGWTHTSDTPGSIWLWTKEIDGKTFLVDKDTAIYMVGAEEEE